MSVPIIQGFVYKLKGTGGSYVQLTKVERRYVTMEDMDPNKGINRILKGIFVGLVEPSADYFGIIIITEGAPFYALVTEELDELLWR